MSDVGGRFVVLGRIMPPIPPPLGLRSNVPADLGLILPGKKRINEASLF